MEPWHPVAQKCRCLIERLAVLAQKKEGGGSAFFSSNGDAYQLRSSEKYYRNKPKFLDSWKRSQQPSRSSVEEAIPVKEPTTIVEPQKNTEESYNKEEHLEWFKENTSGNIQTRKQQPSPMIFPKIRQVYLKLLQDPQVDKFQQSGDTEWSCHDDLLARYINMILSRV